MALLNSADMWVSYQMWREHYLDNALLANWIQQGRPAMWQDVAKTWTKRVTYGMVWQFSSDVQAFVNAAAQVHKCVRLLGAEGFPPPPDGPSIPSVRNFEEHWDNPKDFTVEAVRSAFGNDIQPGMVAAVSSDLFVGNLSMGAVEHWIRKVKRAVAKELRAEGITPPTDRSLVWDVGDPERVQRTAAPRTPSTSTEGGPRHRG